MGVSRAELEQSLARLVAVVGDPRAGIYGPGSIAWVVNRESALMLGGGRAALLQLAHPFVAHAIDQHSDTRRDPLGRFRRTFGGVFAMVFGDLEHALASARRVHAVHTRIHGPIGEDIGAYQRGDPYDANDPDALFWVHATLVDSALQVYERVVRPLRPAERARYYEETKRQAWLFGIPDSSIPATYVDFVAYFERMCRDVLRVGKPARELAGFILAAPTPLHGPASAAYRNFTAGLLPPSVRAGYGLPFGRLEALALDAGSRAAKQAYALMPRSLRYFPAYLEAERRVAGGRRTRRVELARSVHRLVVRSMSQRAEPDAPPTRA